MRGEDMPDIRVRIRGVVAGWRLVATLSERIELS